MPSGNPSSPADRRKNPARSKDRRVSKRVTREYRVVPHGERWDVERDGKATRSFAYDVNTAIGLATAEAQRDVRSGADASVRVEENDGTSRQVWP